MNSILRFLNTRVMVFTIVLGLASMIIVPLLVGSDQSVSALAYPEPGDYQSARSGIWNNASNWEVWDDDSWDSTSTWPGQNPGDGYTVTIQSGHVISDNNVNTLYFGDLIVYGHLNLSNNLYLENTNYLLVDGINYNGSDITTGGSVSWFEKLELHLPANAVLGVMNVKDNSGTVIEGLGLYAPNSGNNKMRLVVGATDYAAAVGGGNVKYTFDDINENGGILTAIASVNPEEFYYEGSSTTFTSTLTGQATGLGSGTEYTSFTWTGTGPDDFYFSYDGQNPGPVNLGCSAGTYIFTLTVESSYDSYTYRTSQEAVVIIHPAPLTITALDQTKEHDDANFTLDQTKFSVAGLMDGDTVTSVNLTSDGAVLNAEVGRYDIIPEGASGPELSNYTITYVNGTLWVGNQTITITVLNQSKDYGVIFPYEGTFTGTEIGGLIADGIIKIDGLQGSDTVDSITLTSGGTAASATVARYTITPSAALGNGLENYTIAYFNGVLTVNPRALSITANSSSKTYGDTVTFAETEFTTDGLVNGDTVTGVTLTSDGAAKDATAGIYTITPSAALGNSLENYTIAYFNGVLTVNPRALSITANSTSKTYGDTVTFAGTEFTTDGLVNGDTVTGVTLTSDGATKDATAGIYTITPSAALGNGLENYTISYVNGTLSVTDNLLLTITALEQAKEYGSTFDFEGTEFTVEGLIEGDTVDSVTMSSYGAAASAIVGTYSIIPSEAFGTGLDNYTIIYVDGALTVNPGALSITANSTSKTYGDPVTFAGTEFTTDGLVNGDTVSSMNLTSDGTAASATVGTYTITPSAALGNGLENYAISYVDGSLTVNPEVLTITANSTSKTYGDLLTFTGTEFTSDGLVNGDTVSSMNLTSDGTAASATVGTYTITPGAALGNGLENYAIRYVDGSLTVNPEVLTITANSTSKTYGDPLTFTGKEFTSDGLVNGDAIASVNLTSDGTTAIAAVENSPYTILASNARGSGLDNYTITYINGELIIYPLTIHVTANPQSKTCGEVDPVLTCTYFPELVGNDTFTGTLSRVAGEDEGSYAITQGTLTLNSNYILDYTEADLTIVQIQASFEVNNLMITPSTNETWAGITFTRETNEKVLVSLDVTNFGEFTGTYHGVLKLNGKEISSKDITLGTGESGQLTFALNDLPTGDYTVEVEYLSAEFSRDKWTNLWLISNLILTVIFIGYLIKRYAFKGNTRSSN